MMIKMNNWKYLIILLSVICWPLLLVLAVDDLVSVSCGSETIEVFLSREVEDIYAEKMDSYVIGLSCKLSEFNSTHFYAEMGLFDCENEYRRMDENITITNVLQPLIVTQRESVLRVRIACYYSTHLHVDLEDFSPSPSSAVSLTTKDGKLVFAAMENFQDVSQEANPQLSLDDSYFVGVYLSESNHSYNFSLFTCWFDSHQIPVYSDVTNAYSDVIISNSCPKSEVSSWAKVNDRRPHENIEISLQVSGIKSLRPLDEFVYFHCQVELCYDSCISSCSDQKREKRSGSTDLSTVQTFEDNTAGNILTLKLQLPKLEEEVTSGWSTSKYVFYVLLGLLALACLIIIFVTYRWWRIKRELELQGKRRNPYMTSS